MKNLILLTLLLVAFTACKTSVKDQGKLRHVVLFAWNEDTSQEKIDELVDLFASLEDKIDVIEDFEYGEDVSIEKAQRGYTHAFIMTFADEKARNVYLPHPEHLAFGKAIKPYMKQVLVVDYLVH